MEKAQIDETDEGWIPILINICIKKKKRKKKTGKKAYSRVSNTKFVYLFRLNLMKLTLMLNISGTEHAGISFSHWLQSILDLVNYCFICVKTSRFLTKFIRLFFFFPRLYFLNKNYIDGIYMISSLMKWILSLEKVKKCFKLSIISHFILEVT